MENIYATSNNDEILRDRLKELSRIRQRYAAQLGSTLYAATKDNEELRWGNEALFDGIASCDTEREQIVERLAKLAYGQAPVNENKPAPEPEQKPVAEPQIEYNAAPENNVEVESEQPEAIEETQQTEADVVADSAEVAPEEATTPIAQPEVVAAQPSGPAAPQEVVAAQPESVPAPAQAPAGRQGPQCGATVGENDRFCMECGNALSAAPEPVIEQKPCCPACGSEIDPSFKFCMICGHRLA